MAAEARLKSMLSSYGRRHWRSLSKSISTHTTWSLLDRRQEIRIPMVAMPLSDSPVGTDRTIQPQLAVFVCGSQARGEVVVLSAGAMYGFNSSNLSNFITYTITIKPRNLEQCMTLHGRLRKVSMSGTKTLTMSCYV